MKYFYDDPFKAAWMAEKFGVKFELKESRIKKSRITEGELKAFAAPWYVKKKSYPVFEPQAGDVILYDEDRQVYDLIKEVSEEFFGLEDSEEKEIAEKCFSTISDETVFPHEVLRILERKGVPFMMPEVKK